MGAVSEPLAGVWKAGFQTGVHALSKKQFSDLYEDLNDP